MKKILIVEDDTYILNIYSLTFRKAGFEVDEASNGHESLTKLNTNTYDMILLDIMLPDITGIEILTEIRKENHKAKDTPVFLATNLGQDDIIKEAFKIGADGYFIKGQLNPTDIVNEINLYFSQAASGASTSPVATADSQTKDTPVLVSVPPNSTLPATPTEK